MTFIPISIDEYVKLHLKSNPTFNEVELKERLNQALNSYKNRSRCSCGNDLWVIGSAVVGNGCFTCITGESMPTGDYEIDEAITKREYKQDRRHIDEMDITEIDGIFDDAGYEINTDLIPKPSLCITCIKDDDPDEELFCNLTRSDQMDSDSFECYDYCHK